MPVKAQEEGDVTITIDASRKSITTEEARALAEDIRTCESPLKINLCITDITPDGVTEIFNALKESKAPSVNIDFSGNSMKPKEKSDIYDDLIKATKNSLGAEHISDGIVAAIQAVAEVSAAESKEKAKIISEAIVSFIKETEAALKINLSGNRMGPGVITDIAEALKETKASSIDINISHNGIDIESATRLAEAIESSSCPFSIILGEGAKDEPTEIDKRIAVIRIIAGAMKNTTQPLTLKLCTNKKISAQESLAATMEGKIADPSIHEAVSVIIESIKEAKNSVYIDFSYSNISTEEAMALAETIKAAHVLVKVKILDNNGLEDEAMLAVNSALEYNANTYGASKEDEETTAEEGGAPPDDDDDAAEAAEEDGADQNKLSYEQAQQNNSNAEFDEEDIETIEFSLTSNEHQANETEQEELESDIQEIEARWEKGATISEEFASHQEKHLLGLQGIVEPTECA